MILEKLIRDRIPELIREKGEACNEGIEYRKAEPEEMTELLQKKLVEEVIEYLDKPSLDELVDIQEVVDFLALNHGTEPRALRHKAEQKRAYRGGFWNRFVLRSDRAEESSLFSTTSEVSDLVLDVTTDLYQEGLWFAIADKAGVLLSRTRIRELVSVLIKEI